MENLEITCSNEDCNETITLELPKEEYDNYQVMGQLFEYSEAYKELFERCGWVLQQAPFCDICKYEHSIVYMDD